MIAAVFVFYVFNDFLTPFVTKVHVKIRHTDAFWVQETFKNQVVANRVYVRDAHCICCNACRAAAASGPHGYAVRFCKVNKVPHDKVIIHKPHRDYNVQFVFKPFEMFLCRLTVAAAQSVGAKPPQILFVRHAVRRGETGQVPLAEFDRQAAFLCRLGSVSNRLLIAAHAAKHLFFRFEIEFIRLHPHSVGFVHKMPRLNAEQNILRLRILLSDIVNIVCCNSLYAEFLCKRIQTRKNYKLLRDSVILQLNVKIIAEHTLKAFCKAARFIVSVHQQKLRNIARKTCRKAYKPLAMLFQQIIVNARPIIKTVHKRN